MKYLIDIELDNGNEVRAKVWAETEQEAIQVCQKNETIVEFMNDEENRSSQIKNISATAIWPRYVIRYTDGLWRCVDTRYGFVLTWEGGLYNETAKASRTERIDGYPPFDTCWLDELETATAMKDMGDWLYTFHHEKVHGSKTNVELLAEMMRNALRRSGLTVEDLSARSGLKANQIRGILDGYRNESMGKATEIVKAMGAEWKIVFPDD